jgi:glutamate 5-kinase
MAPAKKPLTVVIKIGSSTLTTPDKRLDLHNLTRLVDEAAALVKGRHRVVIVSSGAIVAGAQRLNLGKPKTIPEKQAAAAVGQSLLMRQYEKAFEKHGIAVAQILLTRDVITDRERSLNARNCFHTLLAEGVVPVVNENDVVAVEEIKIGDNDTLAALTAGLIGADKLLLLTDVDGFYLKDQDGKPYLVEKITRITPQIKAAAGQPSSQSGTGGMATKLEAARLALPLGVSLTIANGRKKGLLTDWLGGGKVGTFFPAAKKK